jgi:hypothetical protein
MAVSTSRTPVETTTLAYRAATGSPIEDDFRDIREADLVVFQNNEAFDSPYVNPRLSEYARFIR